MKFTAGVKRESYSLDRKRYDNVAASFFDTGWYKSQYQQTEVKNWGCWLESLEIMTFAPPCTYKLSVLFKLRGKTLFGSLIR